MTKILQVVSQYCSQYVDDENLNLLAAEDAPVYALRMWGYLRAAIPLFSTPATMPVYLLGTVDAPMLTEPKFTSYQYVVPQNVTSDVTVQLGNDYTGYELFCCRLRTEDDFGNVIMIPVTIASYNPETGAVTFSASQDEPLLEGTVFDMDFYLDGYFERTLSPEIMNILGMCFQVVWQDRFNTDWLSMKSKIEDKSFSEQNRANKIRADTERLKALQEKLSIEIRNYERNIVYRKMFPQKSLF